MYSKKYAVKERKVRTVWVGFMLWIILCMMPANVGAVDEENWLFCHKYRGLSYIIPQSDRPVKEMIRC